MVNGVKDKELGSTFQVASQPITRNKEQIGWKVWPWIIGFDCLLTLALKEAGLAQPAFDGQARRRRFNPQPVLQLPADSARSNQADFGFVESASQIQDKLAERRRISLGRTFRSLRRRDPSLPAVLVKAAFPLKEPGARAWDQLENVLSLIFLCQRA